MRVFVAGATGVVGQQLVPQLIAAGHQVTATTRSAGKVGRRCGPPERTRPSSTGWTRSRSARRSPGPSPTS